MKYSDKLYVGLGRPIEGSPALGFAVSDHEPKRKETVDRWRDKAVEPMIVDNVPTPGLWFTSRATRYMTDKEYMRVSDPRGFTLEISVENLLELLESVSTERGVITDPTIWTWGKNGKVYLTTPDNKSYIEAKEDFEKKQNGIVEELVEGKYYKITGYTDEVYQYVGRVQVTRFKNSWGRKSGAIDVSTYKSYAFIHGTKSSFARSQLEFRKSRPAKYRMIEDVGDLKFGQYDHMVQLHEKADDRYEVYRLGKKTEIPAFIAAQAVYATIPSAHACESAVITLGEKSFSISSRVKYNYYYLASSSNKNETFDVPLPYDRDETKKRILELTSSHSGVTVKLS